MIGPYIADFACVAARLVVELDGETHQEAYDIHRDMESRGWRVLRFHLHEVDEDLDNVIAAIWLELENPGSVIEAKKSAFAPSS